ncbi:MAG TPA: metallophosphoesterase [bacterium]|nr:metallophosphoesterase [bacterium]
MGRSRTSIGIVAFVLMLGCASSGVNQSDFVAPWVSEGDKALPWTKAEFRNSPDNFQFVVVSDRNGGHRPRIFEDAVSKINILQPEFVICVGDLIPGYTKSEARVSAQRKEFIGIAEKLEMPFFYVPGNHDITNPMMSEDWHKRFGRSYYHFLYKDVLFLCLNSEDPPADHISQQQVEYVAQALKENRNVRWTFVFIHKPLWDRKGNHNWDKVEALLGDRKHTVFSGHTHRYLMRERNGHDYLTLGVTGGGSALRGVEYGEFDHFLWVTMTEKEPKIANLMLEGVWDKNTLTEERTTMLPSLNRNELFHLEPLWSPGEAFTQDKTVLTISNPFDHRLSVRMNLAEHPSIVSETKELAVTIPPKEVKEIPIIFKASQPPDFLNTPKVLLSWTGAFHFEGKRELKGQGKLPLFLDTIYKIPVRKVPVTVDGILDEWNSLPFICDNPLEFALRAQEWKGAADSSFRFTVERDLYHLYVAVHIFDESLGLAPGKLPWEQDGVEIRIDARADPERSEGIGENQLVDFLLFAMSPTAPDQSPLIAFEDQIPEGMKYACAPTSDGFSAEVAVPISYLNEKQNGSWEQVRINIAVTDFDDELATGSQIWWRPDWRKARNYKGSGTFEK